MLILKILTEEEGIKMNNLANSEEQHNKQHESASPGKGNPSSTPDSKPCGALKVQAGTLMGSQGRSFTTSIRSLYTALDYCILDYLKCPDLF